MIAYATDAQGLYVPAGNERKQRLPRLRAVAVTDNDGFCRFPTVRPGPYPHSDDPAHVHLHINAAVHAHTYRTLWFEGDPRITDHKRNHLDEETVVVPLREREDGVLTCRYDVQLDGSQTQAREPHRVMRESDAGGAHRRHPGGRARHRLGISCRSDTPRSIAAPEPVRALV